MKVFLAGATGAIGRPLVDRLLAGGHEVTALTRSEASAAALRERGVSAVVADAFDRDAVIAAVVAAQPEVVINQLTALPQHIPVQSYAKALEPTNRLRREAGPILAEAAVAAGARRLIAQSVAFFLAPDPGKVLDESAPVWAAPPRPLTSAAEAMMTLERAVLEAPGIEGLVLRYGYFYGPGSSFARDGSSSRDVARGRFPVVGDGGGLFSFIHVDDAAAATVAALDHGAPGVYHVTDDQPVAQRDWLPEMARAMGAPKPRRIPAWLAGLVAGPGIARAAQQLPGASNAKAKRELDWAPSRPTYREGFAEVFSGSSMTSPPA